MKTNITLLLCALIALTACNNDDDTQNPDNGLALYKTVKFSPSEEAYNSQIEGSTKNVKYYENNLVIADTLYNQNGEAESWGAHEYTANSHLSTFKYLDDSGALYTVEDTYDSNGKLIQEKSTYYVNGAISNAEVKAFTYINNSVTLTISDPISNTNYGSFEYLLNSDGLIYHFTGGGDYQTEINYDSQGKPLSYTQSYGDGQQGTTNAAYYDNIPMPSNQLKTASQINNAILKNGMKDIFLECNYHCKSITPSVAFEKTFDVSGNVLYCKQTGYYMQTNTPVETFYYYNQ